MPLFLDIEPVSEHVCNDALEFIFKAHDHGGDGIWRPHESPLVRRMIELFTERGLDRLKHVQEQIIAWQNGDHYKPSTQPITPPGMVQRWTKEELALVRLYLESIPPQEWSLDDHMLSIDYLVQRYLPDDELLAEAEWLATKASFMGKVQANLEKAPTLKQSDTILAALPSTVGEATTRFALAAAEKAALDFARARSAEHVRALSDSVRHKMKGVILQHLQESSADGSSLESKLLDAFGLLNRDWRRIALTEAGNAQLEGFVASVPYGTKLQRIEQYEDACGFCKSIHGKIVTVVSPDQPDKDPDTMVWSGKHNVGRSASPMKRVGDVLVPRTKDELYWLPAGLAHPNCRGRWVNVLETKPGDDEEFGKFLQDLLA